MLKNDLPQILSLLFTSRVRLKIINLFFAKPGDQFHMREIARITDEQINAVRRELMSMEKMETLLTRKDGIKKFFMLNPSFPLYSELRNIAALSQPLAREIFKQRKQLGEIKFAILSHTYLSHEKSDDSNPDILIVGEPDLDILQEIIHSVETEEPKQLFVSVISEKELEIGKRRRDPLVYSLMVLPRTMIIGRDEDFVL